MGDYFPCSKCELEKVVTREFNSVEELETHVRSFHLHWNPYSCYYCEKCSPGEDQMLKHTKKFHPNALIQMCLTANKEEQCKLEEIVTLEEMSLSCVRCDADGVAAEFESVEDIQTHVRDHILYRPYHCMYCECASSSWKNLQIHVKRTHPQQKILKILYIPDTAKEKESKEMIRNLPTTSPAFSIQNEEVGTSPIQQLSANIKTEGPDYLNDLNVYSPNTYSTDKFPVSNLNSFESFATASASSSQSMHHIAFATNQHKRQKILHTDDNSVAVGGFDISGASSSSSAHNFVPQAEPAIEMAHSEELGQTVSSPDAQLKGGISFATDQPQIPGGSAEASNRHSGIVKWMKMLDQKSNANDRPHDNAKYQCRQCGRRLISAHRVAHAVNMHLDGNMFHCSLCQFSGRTKWNIQNHLKNKHPEQPDEVNVIDRRKNFSKEEMNELMRRCYGTNVYVKWKIYQK